MESDGAGGLEPTAGRSERGRSQPDLGSAPVVGPSPENKDRLPVGIPLCYPYCRCCTLAITTIIPANAAIATIAAFAAATTCHTATLVPNSLLLIPLLFAAHGPISAAA